MRRHNPWLLLVVILAGCVMLPVPGSLKDVDLPKAPVVPLDSHEEGVAVLGTTISNDDRGLAHCVRKALQRQKPSLRIVSAREFRNALFPWLDLEASSEELRAVFSDPLVRNATAKLDVHYAVFVSPNLERIGGSTKGSIPYVGSGVAWTGEEVTVSASVWDVKEAQDLGQVRVRASGTDGMVGMALPGIPMGVVWLSDTEGTACRGLGELLGRVLTPLAR